MSFMHNTQKCTTAASHLIKRTEIGVDPLRECSNACTVQNTYNFTNNNNDNN